MLSVALKRILKQERLVPTSRSDPGMPSSHVQSVFFIFSFAIISIVEWLRLNEVYWQLAGFPWHPVLELTSNAVRDNKNNRIVPRHIQLAVRNDEELSKLLGTVTIAN
ncbi:hypothetical protein ACOSQ2_012253 [Xanthoceras sorbifolium]